MQEKLNIFKVNIKKLFSEIAITFSSFALWYLEDWFVLCYFEGEVTNYLEQQSRYTK